MRKFVADFASLSLFLGGLCSTFWLIEIIAK